MRSNKDVDSVHVKPDQSCAETMVDYFQRMENIRHPPTTYYPAKQNRYSLFGWNRDYQDCYSDKDMSLHGAITAEYKSLGTSGNHFNLNTENRFNGWWTCTKPSYQELVAKIDSGSFTLPSRHEKDAKIFPLWGYADSMAKHIGNWQSERVKHQAPALMNDPPMLAFEELRDWFSLTLAESECKTETIDQIAQRQSYIKNLIYLFPNFGADRLHLSDIQESLSDASKIVSNCVTSKNLPQLLSDVVVTGKTLENTLGTYLHFLMIDEQVSDNFSMNDQVRLGRDCDRSPVCQTFRKATRIYALVKTNEPSQQATFDLRLNKSLFDSIKFTGFVSPTDRDNYIESMAALQTFADVRKTLENFHDMQTKIGSYHFADSYLEKANQLANNYIGLIEKTKRSIQVMVKSSEKGLNQILGGQVGHDNKPGHFEKNFKLLETKVAKGTTLVNQFDLYTKNAVESMQKYQSTLKKLATDVREESASLEVEHAKNVLLKEIDHLNAVIPGLINKQSVIIEHSPSSIMIDVNDQSLPREDTTVCQRADNPCREALFDYGKWDNDVRFDHNTNEPIFTYRVFKNTQEVGSAEFYGQPMLCQSADKQRHNLIHTSGIFDTLQIPPNASIEVVCRVLPPTMFERVFTSAKSSAVHGTIRGGSTVVGMTLKSLGVSGKTAFYLQHLSYYLSFFSFQFYCHYQSDKNGVDNNFWLALSQAAIETGETFLISTVSNMLSYALNSIGETLDSHEWKRLGEGFKQSGNLIKYGMFAYRALDKGIPEAAASFVAGTATEMAIEGAGRRMLNA